MKIIHVLADGTQKTDITGHVVKKKDTEIYEIITRIKRRQENEQRKSKL